MQLTEKPTVIPARHQSGLDRILAFLSIQCDELRVSWDPTGPKVQARPKAMLDHFGEPLPPPHRAELDAPDMMIHGMARSVDVRPDGLVIETPGGLVVLVSWLPPRRA